MSARSTRLMSLVTASAAIAAGSTVWLGVQPSAGVRAPVCAGHTATIVGNARSNEIHGTAGRDVIVGLGGNDDIEGRGGNDLICGGLGRDELEGDRGDDHLYGGPGYDEAEGGPGRDTCVAEERESC